MKAGVFTLTTCLKITPLVQHHSYFRVADIYVGSILVQKDFCKNEKSRGIDYASVFVLSHTILQSWCNTPLKKSTFILCPFI